MSDDMASKSSELPDLPDLPDLPELEDMPELPDLPAAEAPAPTKAPAPASSTSDATGGSKAPQKSAPKQKQSTPKPSPAKASAPKVTNPKPGAQKPAPLAELQEEVADKVEKVEAKVDEVASATAGVAAAADVPPSAPGERPPLRSIAGAPVHLKKAAVIVTVGALLPFMNHGGTVMTFAGKVVALIGIFLWFKQVEHNWGPKLKGFLGNLAELRLAGKKKKDDEDKAPRRSTRQADPVMTLEHPFPTAMHVVSLLLILTGCLVLPMMEGDLVNKGKAIAELGMLTWASATIVHIHAYERWGKFNPIFPLMFAGMAFAGITSAIGGFSGVAEGFSKIAMIVGGGLVGLGGGLAAFTIVEAMMQAKKEGDLKKQAQLEERRQARASRGRKTDG